MLIHVYILISSLNVGHTYASIYTAHKMQEHLQSQHLIFAVQLIRVGFLRVKGILKLVSHYLVSYLYHCKPPKIFYTQLDPNMYLSYKNSSVDGYRLYHGSFSTIWCMIKLLRHTDQQEVTLYYTIYIWFNREELPTHEVLKQF